MKYRIAIMVCYYGKFPGYFPAFLMSCARNPLFEWIIFSDCDCKAEIPANVRIVEMTFSEIKTRIESVMGLPISLEKPYKLCDFKPSYGDVFADYLSEYDFWGYCDLDIILGNLGQFITDEVLKNFDKIYLFGHLSLIRNSKKCNKIYKIQSPDTLDYYEVFTRSQSFYFDEIDWNKKWFQSGQRVYERIDFFDRADMYRDCLISVDKKVMKGAFPGSFMERLGFPENHLFQLLSWENGKLYRNYFKGLRMKREELSYVHFRCDLKLPDEGLSQKNKYYITAKRLIPVEGNTTLCDILKYNLRVILRERRQYNEYMVFQHQRERIGDKIKDQLYSIKPLRVIVHKVKGQSK